MQRRSAPVRDPAWWRTSPTCPPGLESPMSPSSRTCSPGRSRPGPASTPRSAASVTPWTAPSRSPDRPLQTRPLEDLADPVVPQRHTSHPQSVRKEKNPVQIGSEPGLTGAAFGIRTRDLRITSALLWPSELRRRAVRTMVRSATSVSLHSFPGAPNQGSERPAAGPGGPSQWSVLRALSSAFRPRGACRGAGRR